MTGVQKKELETILDEFADAEPGQTHVAEHSINTESRPIRQVPYRIPQAYREEVMKELAEMEERGVIEPSYSEWASPIVVVKKKDGGLWLCVDFNAATSLDACAYPMPRTDELLDKLVL